MKLLMRVAVMVLTLAAPALAAEYKAGEVTVINPWARATAGVPRNGGAYLTLKGGAGGDRLTGVETTVAKRAGLHGHTNENGMMKMRSVKGIDVPAGGMTMLKPGGFHVMLMKLKQPLKEGDSFPMTLHFANAGKLTVEVRIMAVGAKDAGTGHGHHGHGKMKMKDDAPAEPDMARMKLSQHKHYMTSIKPQATKLSINVMHRLILEIKSPQGKPVKGAKVSVDGTMPNHGHGLPTSPRVTQDLGNGKYLVEGVKFNMAGWWQLKFRIVGGHHNDQVAFNFILK